MNDTVIVGASAAGLATAACLAKAGQPFVLLEKGSQVAGAWRNHYRRLHLHTSKGLSALPYLPWPRSAPKYPAREQVVEYLENYARHFQLEPRFNESVISIKRDGDGWLTKTLQNEFRSRNVVVATGYTRVPFAPQYPGRFDGEILHSSKYRDGSAYEGKRVLVVGFGNSGGEIALDLLEHGAKVSMSVRSPVNIVPRDFLGIPILAWGIVLWPLPLWLSDGISAVVRSLTIGSLEKLGLRKLPYGPLTQIKKHRRVPLLDIGTAAQIKAGKIEVLPGIKSLSTGGAHFENGEQRDFDAIVLATGYRPATEELLTDKDAPGLHFCGFYVGPGMLRVIAGEARRIAAQIASRA
jgi:indole-3-pyruvate monooxygenase